MPGDIAQPPIAAISLVPGAAPLVEDVREGDHAKDNSGGQDRMAGNAEVD